MKKALRVPPEQLRKTCGYQNFGFKSTAEITPLEDIIGQERAVRAIDFGLKVDLPGYNIYLSGLTGTGKTSYAKSVLRKVAAGQPTPDDWCYVHNFSQPDIPLALRFPPGMGSGFCQDMKELLEDLQSEIPKVFDGEEYESRRNRIIEEHQEKTNQLFSQLEKEVQEAGFILRRTGSGLTTVPTFEGQPLREEDFKALESKIQEEIERRNRQVQTKVTETIRQGRMIEKEAREKIKNLEREMGLFAVGHLIERLKKKYADLDRVVEYLGRVQEDVIDNLDSFKSAGEEKPAPFPWMPDIKDDSAFVKYKVNLFVDNSRLEGAPVIFETNPTYYNLIGKVEYKSHMGGMFTDFTLIKPGAFHLANGGYLVLQVKDVLLNFGSWDALKRTLRNREVRIENLGEQFRLFATAGLKPEAIPLSVKVVLIGNPLLYYLLYHHDEDFRKLFKVKADFEMDMSRSPDHIEKYATFISTICHRENLRHFEPSGVARVVEYSSRLAGDQEKLSTRFNEVVEVIYEASAWAELDGDSLVTAEHVEKAIAEKINRSNKPEERLQEMIKRGKLLVDTEGEVVGQVNGLSVLDIGEYSFGRPSRITARTYMGEKGLVNIEREIELSGAIHDKGVLILAGFLGGKYAQDKPLSVSASITFEQVYEEVDGDSASSAELYALLSSLSELPIDQGIAVTGSVNQNGKIQPVGGVNQKIEGFFKTCKERGLNGRQGVIIPRQNVVNLMLPAEIVKAVEEGRFHLWAVETVDQGIEILTGHPAGEVRDDGTYPEDSVHGRVSRRLKELAQGLVRFSKQAREESEGETDKQADGT